jgi:hypothetical protein
VGTLRWERSEQEEDVGASAERIKLKMLRSSSVEWGNTKKVTCRGCGGGEREDTVASQKYTPVPRARGTY